MPSLSAAAIRYVLILAGIVLLGLVIVFGVHSCDVRHNKAAQTRVERSQAEAASNSAADAIGAVAANGRSEAASEELTRQNEHDIRSAEGANASVNPAARDAGLTALCRREAYRNSPKCSRK